MILQGTAVKNQKEDIGSAAVPSAAKSIIDQQVEGAGSDHIR